MDVRYSSERKRLPRWLLWAVAGGGGVLLAVVAVWLGARPPALERDGIWTAKVRVDSLVSEVNVSGELVAEDLRAITNRSEGVVERIVRRPGDEVAPGDVLIEMSSPELEEELAEARWDLKAKRTNARRKRMETADELLHLETRVTQANADYLSQRLGVEAHENLAKEGGGAYIDVERSKLEMAALLRHLEAEQSRLERFPELQAVREEAVQARLAQRKQQVARLEERVSALKVVAGMAGVVRDVEVEEGQRIVVGTAVARVVDPQHLIARVRVPERQAGDIAVGMTVRIEVRGESETLEGRVSRINPTVRERRVEVDVALPEDRPRSLRPDLSVRARIELDRVAETLLLERPSGVEPGDERILFRVTPGGHHAEPVLVHFGRASIREIEVVNGLNTGDEVILSDMGEWRERNRVRLR